MNKLLSYVVLSASLLGLSVSAHGFEFENGV